MIQDTLSQLQKGQLTVQEHAQQYIDAISADSHNIFLQVNETIQEQAKQLDIKRKENKPLGKLFGLCFAIKSNICVEGMNNTCASNTLKEFVSTYDADVITQIKQEDGLILGLVNMDEFACGGSGETSAFGPTINPAAPDYIPGGSSSGSAAAVAAKLCDVALGSDTGGSIRNPASHCGVVGLKPSYGAVSRYGLIDLSMSLDQIGPLTTDVNGCQLVFDVIKGYSENDPTTKELEQNPQTTDTIIVGMSPSFEKLCTDKRIYDKVSSFVTDAKIVELEHVNLAVQTYYPLVYVEFFSGTRKFDGRRYGQKIEESCGDEVLRRILGGQEISQAEHNGKYYRIALAVKDVIAKQVQKMFETVDVLVLPTTPSLPKKLNEQASVEDMYAQDAFTIPANLAGICAGVVPIGTIDSIPVGMQIYAKNEQILFTYMSQIQAKVSKTN